ncbi:DUF4265 domain-containing protein [Actinophytocola oryzae]|uniref:DUF4265 domain-containing protein n=1 Tax=Actinophytocola oryzae TaxID=502181 RepID=UPI0010629FFC|nr:DUF4265 domain-containing protein [Actinophytocola oryzae]
MADLRLRRPYDKLCAMSDQVRVSFALVQDSEGWPPVSAERMWATPTSQDNVVVLDNIPFFVRDVACYDVVAVTEDDEGVLWGGKTLKWSGNCTIRVIPFHDGPLQGNRQAVLDAFAPFGVDGEGAASLALVALNVPADADLVAVKRLLREGEKDRRWTWEEACIGDAWADA